ncbi:MAG TPA: tetratricopeptide repeat protein, partial [Pyrinomonadaceae bacterium]|nr:tetratricopeptide repeat protein [Pyrinomonadaceae bacterium]
GSWFATRWYIGNVVAEYAPQMSDETLAEEELDAVKLETAMAAMRLAPNDPWTHWVVAGLKKSSTLPGALEEAIKHYEEAVRLSPNDYRFWVSLGRTRGQAGDFDGGEKALRRAVELAPSYADPRWHLGNLLLRAGRGDEAFTELQRAADADPRLRSQIFNAAWYVYGENVDAIRDAVGASPAARAELAGYTAGRGRLDDALRLWASLTTEEKKVQRESGLVIMRALLAAKRHRAALAIEHELNPDAPQAKPEEFLNPGFETDIEVSEANAFGWKVTSLPQAQIGFDETQRHDGFRSLRVAFRSPSTLVFNNISQMIVVEPGSQYRLEYYVRTEELKSGGTPVTVVIDGADGTTVLAASQPLANGTREWEPVTIDFKVPPKSEAVIVRVGRMPCGSDPVCPIFGFVWYDDFNLKRGSGGQAAANAGGGAKPNAR